MTITPSEAAIIAADRTIKLPQSDIVFVDRFTGSLFTGPVSFKVMALNEATFPWLYSASRKRPYSL